MDMDIENKNVKISFIKFMQKQKNNKHFGTFFFWSKGNNLNNIC